MRMSVKAAADEEAIRATEQLLTQSLLRQANATSPPAASSAQKTSRASARGNARERGAGGDVPGAGRGVAAAGAQEECEGCSDSSNVGSEDRGHKLTSVTGGGSDGSGNTSVLTTAGAVEELLAILPHDMRRVSVYV